MSVMMLAFALALSTLIFAEVRRPFRIANGGWLWAVRGIHLVGFFVISLLVVGLGASYL